MSSINELPQWALSMNSLNELHLWALSISFLNGLHQWAPSMSSLNELSQWAFSISSLNELSQWAFSMSSLNELSQWVLSISFLNELSQWSPSKYLYNGFFWLLAGWDPYRAHCPGHHGGVPRRLPGGGGTDHRQAVQDHIQVSHRRRIKTRRKGKGRPYCLGRKNFFKFLAALAILTMKILNNRMNCIRMIKRKGWIHPVLPIRPIVLNS